MSYFSDSPTPPTLLVVDDAPEQVWVLRCILEEAGCRVLTAQNGWEGLERARRDRPDLVLLDLLMPSMDGYEVLLALRKDPETEGIPVLLVTLLGGGQEVAAGLDAGARDFIQKPFHAKELLARIRTHLEWARGLERERALRRELDAAHAEIQRLHRERAPLAPRTA